MLSDPARTGYVAVALPEEMPVNETIELERRLRDAIGLGLDAIVMNAMWPERFSSADVTKLRAAARDGHDESELGAVRAALAAHERVKAQRAHLRRLDAATDAPITTLPFVFESELGPRRLRAARRRARGVIERARAPALPARPLGLARCSSSGSGASCAWSACSWRERRRRRAWWLGGRRSRVLVVATVAVPALRWRRWRWDVRDEGIDIQHGTLAISRTLVPWMRVQHVDTRRGLFEQSFGLSTVVVHTAAGGHTIPLLRQADAEQLRERIAGLRARTTMTEPRRLHPRRDRWSTRPTRCATPRSR